VSPNLEDMYPFLDPEELASNMLISETLISETLISETLISETKR